MQHLEEENNRIFVELWPARRTFTGSSHRRNYPDLQPGTVGTKALRLWNVQPWIVFDTMAEFRPVVVACLAGTLDEPGLPCQP